MARSMSDQPHDWKTCPQCVPINWLTTDTREWLKRQPIAEKHNSDTPGAKDFDFTPPEVLYGGAHLKSLPIKGKVVCLDCGWLGHESQLKAQACPLCDGRCADV